MHDFYFLGNSVNAGINSFSLSIPVGLPAGFQEDLKMLILETKMKTYFNLSLKIEDVKKSICLLVEELRL